MDRDKVIETLQGHPMLQGPLDLLFLNLIEGTNLDPQGLTALAIVARLKELAGEAAVIVLDDPPAKPDMSAPGWKKAFANTLVVGDKLEHLVDMVVAVQEDIATRFPEAVSGRPKFLPIYAFFLRTTAIVAAMLHHDLDPELIKFTEDERAEIDARRAAAAGATFTAVPTAVPAWKKRHSAIVAGYARTMVELGHSAVALTGTVEPQTVLCLEIGDETWAALAAVVAPTLEMRPALRHGQRAVGFALVPLSTLEAHLPTHMIDLRARLQRRPKDGHAQLLVLAAGIAGASDFDPGVPGEAIEA